MAAWGKLLMREQIMITSYDLGVGICSSFVRIGVLWVLVWVCRQNSSNHKWDSFTLIGLIGILVELGDLEKSLHNTAIIRNLSIQDAEAFKDELINIQNVIHYSQEFQKFVTNWFVEFYLNITRGMWGIMDRWCIMGNLPVRFSFHWKGYKDIRLYPFQLNV